MAIKIFFSNKAIEDLKDIGRYTEERWGKDQRNAYLLKVDTGIKVLASDPLSGPACGESLSGYRKYRVGKHYIFYRYDATYIHIVRILHERMDVAILH